MYRHVSIHMFLCGCVYMWLCLCLYDCVDWVYIQRYGDSQIPKHSLSVCPGLRDLVATQLSMGRLNGCCTLVRMIL